MKGSAREGERRTEEGKRGRTEDSQRKGEKAGRGKVQGTKENTGMWKGKRERAGKERQEQK